jgi:hypothetical protein
LDCIIKMGCNSSSQQALLLSEIEKLQREKEQLQSQLIEANQKLHQQAEAHTQELDKKQSDFSQSQARVHKLKEKQSGLKAKHSLITERDIIIGTTNSSDRHSRLGASGKFYCQGPLNASCSCCDGNCGPTNGCNCVACMELDVASRCLPKGYLVNKEGRISKLAPNGNVYCGSKVMSGVPGCDGWCGPNNGPQCSSCSILQTQWSERYSKITWG